MPIHFDASRSLLSLITLASTALAFSVHAGNVIYVDDDAPPGGDGQSWNTAFRYLQDALAIASEPVNLISEVRVAQGTYRPDEDESVVDGSGDRSATFQLINNVAIMGGYAGIGAMNPDLRDIKQYETTLSGDLDENDGPAFQNYDDNSFHIATGNGTTSTAIVEGFTIRAGNANTSGFYPEGAGLILHTGSPSIANCRFIENRAKHGGAVYMQNESHPTILACDFIGNSAFTSYGGGLYIRDDSKPVISACQFFDNESKVLGGAITAQECDPIVTDCVFIGNHTEIRGGAIICRQDSKAFIANCTFIENHSDTDGGAVQFDSGDSFMINCRFVNNSASLGGGALVAKGGEVVGCTFEGNSANVRGGGVVLQYARVYFSDCLVTNNQAEIGGGIYCDGTDSAIVNSIVENNDASLGGGLYIGLEATSLSSSTIRYNSASHGAGLYVSHSDSDISFCDIAANVAHLAGGGFYIEQCAPIVAHCSIANNETEFDPGGGGAVYSIASDPLVLDCQFLSNNALTGGIGGGLLSLFGSPTILDCSFTGQLARQGAGIHSTFSNTFVAGCVFEFNETYLWEDELGGAMYNNASNSMILDTTFYFNRSNSGGGAIFNQDTELFMVNSELIYNMIDDGYISPTPGEGAGIYSNESNSVLINCTIAKNSFDYVLTGSGGGIYNDTSTSALLNSIVWSNDEAEIFDDSESLTLAEYSNIEGGWPGIGNIDSNPLFVSTDKWAPDFHLLSGSPCIDAGSNDAVPVDVKTDLDGNPRFIDDPDTPDTGAGNAPIVDMGAYEFQIEDAPCIADLDASGNVGFADLLLLLDAWNSKDPSADLDGSGSVGFTDLLLLLDAWGPCA